MIFLFNNRHNELLLWLKLFLILFFFFFKLSWDVQLELDRYTGFDSTTPPLAAMLTGVTYYAPSGLRVAALGGALGLGTVGATYTAYTLVGKPFGSNGFLWF